MCTSHWEKHDFMSFWFICFLVGLAWDKTATLKHFAWGKHETFSLTLITSATLELSRKCVGLSSENAEGEIKQRSVLINFSYLVGKPFNYKNRGDMAWLLLSSTIVSGFNFGKRWRSHILNPVTCARSAHQMWERHLLPKQSKAHHIDGRINNGFAPQITN